jgi:site-specific recombinase XerD
LITISQSKHGAARYVHINSVAERVLQALAENCNDSGYVSKGSDQRGGRDWERWFEECVREAKIADFRWHDLRNTFASRLTMAGVSMRTLAELLGHKTLAMVMRYARLAPAHLRDAVERIAGTPTDTTIDTVVSGTPETRVALPN